MVRGRRAAAVAGGRTLKLLVPARAQAPADALALLAPCADPFPLYRRLRDERPVFFLPAMKSWVLLRHTDCLAALREPRLSAARTQALLRAQVPDAAPGELSGLAGVLERTLLMSDGQAHRRLRSLAARAFTPRALQGARGLVRGVLVELVDALGARPGFEAVSELCAPFPSLVIARLMGVPEADWPSFHRWTLTVTRLFGSTLLPKEEAEAAQAAALDMLSYFQRLVVARRADPQADLISQIVARGADAGLEPDAVAVLCVEIVGAAHNTTLDLLATALHTLVTHPGERRRLREEPATLRTATEELLRFAGPLLFANRVASEDLLLAGQTVRAGELVSMFLASANRDPAAFEAPERLDLGRQENPHLSLGGGAHVCLGAPLARIELEELLTVLTERLPALELDGPVTWRDSIQLRGVASLPLRTR